MSYKNRAVSEIRHALSKHGGNMGENGCVAWKFDKKGYMVIAKETIGEDALMEKALEAGAEDVRDDGENWEVISDPDTFADVKEALDSDGIAIEVAEVTMLPQNMTPIEGDNARKLLRLLDALDDCDDVQKVYTNADIPDEVMEHV